MSVESILSLIAALSPNDLAELVDRIADLGPPNEDGTNEDGINEDGSPEDCMYCAGTKKICDKPCEWCYGVGKLTGEYKMSSAWEITQGDIRHILDKHNVVADLDDIHDLVCEQEDRVEKAALAFNEMEEQTASALDEIENILIEEKILSGPKLFSLV